VSKATAAVPFPEARVLIVDDEPGVRSVLSRFLNLLGYCADEAACGQEALDMLERALYDVIVLDIRMPGMDGVEVMQRVHQKRPDLPTILLTGHASVESAIAAVKSRAADYLLKPVGMRDLAAAIARALQQRAQQMQPRSFASERFLQAGPLALDRERHLVVVARTDAAHDLSAKVTVSEAALLIHLMQHPGIALSCRDLARAALGYDVSEPEARRIIRPHICRLRKKIEPDPDHPRLILTAPDRRYLFNP
jgi:DNA-binding response OmpR family regulator